MNNTKKFTAVLLLFIVILGLAMYWFEISESDTSENEYLPLPDSLVSQLNAEDSTEKANFLSAPSPNNPITINAILFTEKNAAYTFTISRDSTQTTLSVSSGTAVIGKITDKILKQFVKAETTDLNNDGNPEILIYLKSNHVLSLVGYEVQNGIHKFTLPPLMGRQAFGYSGKDTIFVENNAIIRKFQFRDAQFSAFPSGTRTCEYALGYDLKFTMTKTLDTE